MLYEGHTHIGKRGWLLNRRPQFLSIQGEDRLALLFDKAAECRVGQRSSSGPPGSVLAVTRRLMKCCRSCSSVVRIDQQ